MWQHWSNDAVNKTKKVYITHFLQYFKIENCYFILKYYSTILLLYCILIKNFTSSVKYNLILTFTLPIQSHAKLEAIEIP